MVSCAKHIAEGPLYDLPLILDKIKKVYKNKLLNASIKMWEKYYWYGMVWLFIQV
jgi:hypothetical protein